MHSVSTKWNCLIICCEQLPWEITSIYIKCIFVCILHICIRDSLHVGCTMEFVICCSCFVEILTTFSLLFYVSVHEQECAAGFYRLRAGWLASAPASRVPTAAGMGSCVRCQCSGHSSTCDPETSVCQVPVRAFTCLCVLDEFHPWN